MRRAQDRRRRRTGNAGFSLVEVMVAMLIGAVMVTAVLGVSVTAKTGGAKAQHRQMFDQGIAQLSAELKQYVTACGCWKTGGGVTCTTPSVPATNCTTVLGPNTNNAGAATWYLNGAAGAAGNISDSQGNVWALACGVHTIRGIVPTLEAAPYNGAISYNVVGWPNAAACIGGPPGVSDTPQIQFTASWTEP